MTNTVLNDPPFLAQLIVDGLNRYDDRPCMYLGDTIASYRDVRFRTSQFTQALQSKGVKSGMRVAVISGNRPEVLYNIAAMQLAGCCGTPLHPLGSLDDHAYVMNDAGIEALIFDGSLFGQRAAELKEKVPSLKYLLSFGETSVGENYSALADNFEPLPLIVPDADPDAISSITYTGGTTGKPKGVMQAYRSSAYMTMIQMLEWQFPEDLRMLIATPLSHAGAAFFVPCLLYTSPSPRD